MTCWRSGKPAEELKLAAKTAAIQIIVFDFSWAFNGDRKKKAQLLSFN